MRAVWIFGCQLKWAGEDIWGFRKEVAYSRIGSVLGIMSCSSPPSIPALTAHLVPGLTTHPAHPRPNIASPPTLHPRPPIASLARDFQPS